MAVAGTHEIGGNNPAVDKTQGGDHSHDDSENDSSSQAVHPLGKMAILEMHSH